MNFTNFRLQVYKSHPALSIIKKKNTLLGYKYYNFLGIMTHLSKV